MMDRPPDFRDIFRAEPRAVAVVKGRLTGCDCAVPSFVPGPHYAANFGKQWARFRDVQLDSVNGTTISRAYLEALIGEPVERLAGKTVLEIGAGAGRFTEYFVKYAGLVVAVDLSEAIFVNAALGARNLVPAQADLLAMPPMARRFDLVFCRGVLQHTPDPVRAIAELGKWVAPGGVVAFDIYAPGRLGRLDAKYLFRPIIQRMWTYESFLDFLERYAEPILRLRWRLKPFLPGKTKQLLDFVLPVYDYKGFHPLTDEQLIEWGKLDTLDAFFARYDNPMRFDEVIETLGRLGFRVLAADRTLNAFRATISPGAADS
ncbi:class I SAM-dependent methyltransferase [Nitrospira sp. Kam-Ns4a]